MPTAILKWREAITDELESMKEKKVWYLVERYTLPQYKYPIPMKWVFKKNKTTDTGQD